MERVIIFWDIAKCCQNKLLNCCLRQWIHISEFIFKLEMSFYLSPSIPLTCPFDMGGSKIKCRLLKLVWSLFYSCSLWIKPSVCLKSFRCFIYLCIWHGYAWKLPAKVGRVDDVIMWIFCFSSCIEKYCVLCAHA